MDKKQHNEFVDRTDRLVSMSYGFSIGGFACAFVGLSHFLFILSVLLIWILLSGLKIRKSLEEKLK